MEIPLRTEAIDWRNQELIIGHECPEDVEFDECQ